MEKHRFRRRLLIQKANAADQGQEIEKFPEENRQDLPDPGYDACKPLEAPDTVEFVGQQALEQRDLFKRVENGIDPVCILKRKGNTQCLIHGSPPAALPGSSP